MSHHYIEFKNVSYSYPDGVDALRNVSFRITHGEKVALMGLNGAGKSTLLKLCNGLLLPTEGEVNIGGIAVTSKTLRLVRQSVGMVFQNPDDQLFMNTVAGDVGFGPVNMGLEKAEVERRVDAALRRVDCLYLKERQPFTLSGGQKRSVAIATVLSMEPNILVLDEPTSNLDWKARRNVMEIIRDFDHTCLVATHDIPLVRELCRRVIFIDGGQVIADNLTENIFNDRQLLESVGLTDADIGCRQA